MTKPLNIQWFCCAIRVIADRLLSHIIFYQLFEEIEEANKLIDMQEHMWYKLPKGQFECQGSELPCFDAYLKDRKKHNEI
nr:hypothetical protein [Sedimentibacter sp.]